MDAIIEYFKANPLFFWIIVACVAILLIVIIVAIAKAAHKSKQKAATDKISENNTAPATAAATVPSVSEEILQANSTAEPEAQASVNSASAAMEVPVETTAKDNAASFKTQASDSQVPDDKLNNAKDDEAETNISAKENKESGSPVVNTDQSHIASRAAAEKLIEKTTEEEDDKKSIYTGKWVILKNEDNTYYFELRASNGEKLLTSINYTSIAGAKNGIKTHKNNILRNNLVISQNKKKQYFFKLLNGSKQLLCTGETYPTKSRCESAVDSVKRFAESAVVTVKKDGDEPEEN